MKRKKRNLSALITAGLVMCALNSFSITIATKEYICPVGNEKFTAGISLPQQCPENKFVMFKENFTKEELKKYEKIINSKEYKAIPINPIIETVPKIPNRYNITFMIVTFFLV